MSRIKKRSKKRSKKNNNDLLYLYLDGFSEICHNFVSEARRIVSEENEELNNIIDIYQIGLNKSINSMIRQVTYIYNKSSQNRKKYINDGIRKAGGIEMILKGNKLLKKGILSGSTLKILVNLFHKLKKLIRLLFNNLPNWLDKLLDFIDTILENIAELLPG